MHGDNMEVAVAGIFERKVYVANSGSSMVTFMIRLICDQMQKSLPPALHKQGPVSISR